MPQPNIVESVSDFRPAKSATTERLRFARVLGTLIFIATLALMVFTSIPYGTAEPWWKAFFVCAALTLTIFWLLEGLWSKSWLSDDWQLFLPAAALVVYACAQSIAFGNFAGGASTAPWNALSADPYQTRFFALQLMGLVLAGILLLRYADSEQRLRVLINVVIGIAVASALFGILRQTTQHSPGFGLPIIAPGQGYGQFINRNHFAYLMEMAFGLTLGLVLGGGIKREQALIYLAALLPVWTALVLCGSRGGLMAMLAQVFIGVLLLSSMMRAAPTSSKAFTLARSVPARIAMIIVLVGGVGFGTLWLGGDQLATRIEATHTEFQQDPENSRQGVKRNEVWLTSWRMFAAHPIFGVGMGAYWIGVTEFHDASGSMTPQEAHNDYLELLASGGIVGLLICAWFAKNVLTRIRQNLNSPHRFRRAACLGASIGLAGVAVHSLGDFGLHMIANAFVFTTLIVIAASKPRWANQQV